MTTTVNEPATEAGREMLGVLDRLGNFPDGYAVLKAFPDDMRERILAVEAEAAERAIGAEAHDATYVDDGADGYLACRCGWGHVLGEDALVDHIHDARLTQERNGQR